MVVLYFLKLTFAKFDIGEVTNGESKNEKLSLEENTQQLPQQSWIAVDLKTTPQELADQKLQRRDSRPRTAKELWRYALDRIRKKVLMCKLKRQVSAASQVHRSTPQKEKEEDQQSWPSNSGFRPSSSNRSPSNYIRQGTNQESALASPPQSPRTARVPNLLENNGEFTDKRGKKRSREEWPIVYDKEYNVYLWGIEKLHPFDAQKWKHIFDFLKKEDMLSEESISAPEEADLEILLSVHTQKYIESLKSWVTVSIITGIPICLPSSTIDARYLKRMRYQVGGTILAGELAIHRGWAINIGGGFHHASADAGGGFCPYADITIMIKWLFKFYANQVETAMIVDLDAHQGNGHERDFLGNEKVYIMDVYNKHIYPNDGLAKKAINCKIELDSHTSDAEYLDLVEKNLESSLQKFHPDILVYNAGTDILSGDPLGRLDVSDQGIIQRDALIFKKARERQLPIVMLTSGGYVKRTAEIIAGSILNLQELGLISK